MKEHKFSIKKRILSFNYAFKGIAYIYKTQHNAWIHTAVMLIAVALNIILKVSAIEWVAVIIVISMVLTAEVLNTAIELIVDFISPGFNKLAGTIKDVAAGAVLLTVFFAVIVGAIIYLPKIF